MPPVRFALAGFGAWGKLHAKSIHQDAGAQLVAICAPTEATRAEARGAYPTAQIFADPLEMIPETTMGFPGVRNADERRAIIAYLRKFRSAQP